MMSHCEMANPFRVGDTCCRMDTTSLFSRRHDALASKRARKSPLTDPDSRHSCVTREKTDTLPKLMAARTRFTLIPYKSFAKREYRDVVIVIRVNQRTLTDCFVFQFIHLRYIVTVNGQFLLHPDRRIGSFCPQAVYTFENMLLVERHER